MGVPDPSRPFVETPGLSPVTQPATSSHSFRRLPTRVAWVFRNVSSSHLRFSTSCISYVCSWGERVFLSGEEKDEGTQKNKQTCPFPRQRLPPSLNTLHVQGLWAETRGLRPGPPVQAPTRLTRAEEHPDFVMAVPRACPFPRGSETTPRPTQQEAEGDPAAVLSHRRPGGRGHSAAPARARSPRPSRAVAPWGNALVSKGMDTESAGREGRAFGKLFSDGGGLCQKVLFNLVPVFYNIVRVSK